MDESFVPFCHQFIPHFLDVLLSLGGMHELDRVDQATCVDTTAWSVSGLMLSGRMDCWSWSVDAAEAKKAEGASI